MNQQPAVSTGRPQFIARNCFRAWLPPSHLNRLMLIDGIQPMSYVARVARTGRPLRHAVIYGQKRWRPLDLVARARADALMIQPPADVRLQREIDALQAELEALQVAVLQEKHRLCLEAISTKLTGATLLTEREIVASRLPLPDRSGVYFLLLDDRVVYVGQSVHVFARVAEHMSTKTFDSFAYVACDPSLLDTMESLYIHALRPPLNNRRDGTGVWAPLRLDQLLRGLVA